jgi:hypothetical protein
VTLKRPLKRQARAWPLFLPPPPAEETTSEPVTLLAESLLPSFPYARRKMVRLLSLSVQLQQSGA